MPGTTKDAADLKRVLADPRIGDFEVKVLHNPTVRAAGLAVKRFFSKAKPDDLLLLAITGHGKRDDRGKLFFVNRDTVPDSLWVTGLSAEHVSHEMRNSPARKTVVLLDCCFSGAFVHDEGLAIPLPPAAPGQAATEEDEEDRRTRGTVIITASTSIEQAFETNGDGDKIRSGLFTRCVVDGLETGEADLNRDGEVDVNELYQYVATQMGRIAKGRRQNPTYSAHRMQGVLRIAHSALPQVVDRPQPVRTPRPRPAPVPTNHGPLSRRVLVPLLVLGGLLSGCATQADSTIGGGGCPTPVQVRVAAAPGGLTAYREIAAGFEDWVAGRQHGCRGVDLYVYPVEAGEVTAGLRRGWTTGEDGADYLRDAGPQPDVWLPAAATDVPPGGLRDVIDRVEQVAQTPVVLGVPARARADDGLRRAVLSWPDLFAAVSRDPGVVRADFASSVIARMATAKLYADGTIDQAVARTTVEQPLEKALDAGTYPVGDEAGLLCRQRAARSSTAVIVTEQQLVRFNRGDPLDGACTGAAPPASADRLLAFYPADTPALEQVVVTLDWQGRAQSATTRAYATWFVRWLRQIPGRQVLLRAGLRPPGLDADEPLGPAYGALTVWPFARVVPDEPDELTRSDTATLHAATRRPGRFLVALDASGSMRTVTPDPDRTRFEVAAAAVEQAATRLGRRDELGLLTFSGRATREVLPIAPAGADPVGRVHRATAPIQPAGGTPLYEAVRRGASALRAGPGDPLRTLVVLTDGQDTSGQPRPSAAQTAGVRIFVIAVGDVSCADATLAGLATGTGGRCFDAGKGSLEPVLTGLFRAAWETGN
nr:caspase family protein [Actinoplanes friuliensis]